MVVNLEKDMIPSEMAVKSFKGKVRAFRRSYQKMIKANRGRDPYNTGLGMLIKQLDGCESSYSEKGFPVGFLGFALSDILRDMQPPIKIHDIYERRNEAMELLEPWIKKATPKKVALNF